MNPHLKYSNPYQDAGTWYKGNLHTHSAEHSGNASISLKQILNRYRELKYDFLAITDYDHLTQIPETLPCEDILMIPGYEYAREKHMQVLGVDNLIKLDQQLSINRSLEQNGLIILNHPYMNRPPHYTIEELLVLKKYHGIEIFNGLIDRMVGRSLATDLWDELLTRGIQCWGFATDNAHELFDVGRAWIFVQAKNCNARDILDRLKAGNFYASTGAELREITLIQNKLHLETDEETAFRFVGPKGEILKTYLGSLAEYWIEGWEDYIRVEGWNRKGWFWTQPFLGE